MFYPNPCKIAYGMSNVCLMKKTARDFNVITLEVGQVGKYLGLVLIDLKIAEVNVHELCELVL